MYLNIQNLYFSYKSRPNVLQGVSLNVPKGERHGILGANGAGKTTLFRAIASWLPAQGRIRLGEDAIAAREVAFLEAEPYFYPYMTGEEYLRFVRDDLARIAHWNRIFDLPLDRFADEYSTGMKKKLALIAALMTERPVLILDEPFNGVDFESNELLLALLQRNWLDESAVLISSHVLETLTRVCHRISVLRDGQIMRTYSPHEYGALETDIRERALRGLDALSTPTDTSL